MVKRALERLSMSPSFAARRTPAPVAACGPPHRPSCGVQQHNALGRPAEQDPLGAAQDLMTTMRGHSSTGAARLPTGSGAMCVIQKHRSSFRCIGCPARGHASAGRLDLAVHARVGTCAHYTGHSRPENPEAPHVLDHHGNVPLPEQLRAHWRVILSDMFTAVRTRDQRHGSRGTAPPGRGCRSARRLTIGVSTTAPYTPA